YIMYSNELHANFNSMFPFEVQLVNHLKTVKPNTEVIFDANTLSYSEIITKMSELSKIPDVTFKILPNNSNFILGSNDAVNQGEILTLQ
ncbi:MAG: glycosyltransferase family 2 protein, partial [Bacteroidia bacterium]|nr:glycosyltransferase family 2 protein [Bacteroidia bacterium]